MWIYFCFVLAVYSLWKLLALLYGLYREYYMLYQIAMGGSPSMNANIRLYVFVAETEYMDKVTVNELYTFLIKMLDTEVSIQQFHLILRSYKYAVMCRDRTDGSLRGFMVLDIDNTKEINGRKYALMQTDLWFFQNDYSGGPFLYYVTAYYLLKQMILHPFTPLYIVVRALTYKSYIAFCHNLTKGYPRYDLEMPQYAKDLINKFVEGFNGPSDIFDRETSVYKRERSKIKQGAVAELTEKDLQDPHIKFFAERNPGWTKGHQLICLGELSWKDLVWVAWKAVTRARRGRRTDSQQT